jgi:hypothetical protein
VLVVSCGVVVGVCDEMSVVGMLGCVEASDVGGFNV